MANDTPKPTDQDENAGKDKPQSGDQATSNDLEEAQEDAAEQREEEGGYQ